MRSIERITHTEYNWFENPEQGETPSSFKELAETILKPIKSEGMSNIRREPESGEDGAVQFIFNGMKCLFRQTKTTPSKAEQFVTFLKREIPDSEIALFNTLSEVE